MPSTFVPSNCSTFTMDAVVYNPIAGRVDLPSSGPGGVFERFEGSGGMQSMPLIITSTLANGNVVMQCPIGMTSITIAGIAYVPDGTRQITVPAAAATAFLEQFKYGL